MDEPRPRGWATGVASLVAVVVFYFAVPVDTAASTRRLVIGVSLALVAVGAMGWILVQESNRRLRTGGVGLRPLQLLLLLEIVLVGFSLVYYMLATNSSGQMSGLHTRVDALYFAMTTMTTVGFGDIHAVGQRARVLVTLQMAFNLGFLAGFANLLRLAWVNASADPQNVRRRRQRRREERRSRLISWRAGRRLRDRDGHAPRPGPEDDGGAPGRS